MLTRASADCLSHNHMELLTVHTLFMLLTVDVLCVSCQIMGTELPCKDLSPSSHPPDSGKNNLLTHVTHVTHVTCYMYK